MSEIHEFELTGITVTEREVMITASVPETNDEVEFVFAFGTTRPSQLAAAAAQLARRAADDAAILERAAKW